MILTYHNDGHDFPLGMTWICAEYWLTQVLVIDLMMNGVPDADGVLYERYETDIHDETALMETIYFWTFLLEKNMSCRNMKERAIKIIFDELILIVCNHYEMRNVDNVRVRDCVLRRHPHYQRTMR